MKGAWVYHAAGRRIPAIMATLDDVMPTVRRRMQDS
jgi:hypothetical protein